MVGAQYIAKDCRINLLIIQTMSKKLISSDNEWNIYESLGFDDKYIKAGLGWGINQSKIIEMDLPLSYDVITNEFHKSIDDTVDTNKDFTDEDDVILVKLTLAKNHVVFKFTPFQNNLRNSNFSVTSKNPAKVTPGKLVNMAMSSIKTLFLYGFLCYVLVVDAVTENILFFEGMASILIKPYIPSNLMKDFKYINHSF